MGRRHPYAHGGAEAAYRAAQVPVAPGTADDVPAASISNAVDAATDASNASVEALRDDIRNGDGPARIGSPEPETEAERRAAPLAEDR
ncbi:hypothetical protein AB5I41_29375 [Sphingomonas sp. MMS24-JH45]